jgi:hypothetical protein
MTNDDMQLVREYASRQSESAFSALVSRYSNMVYSAALRQTRNPSHAEVITQAVFVILRDGKVTSRSQSLIDVEEIPIIEATAKNIRALVLDNINTMTYLLAVFT